MSLQNPCIEHSRIDRRQTRTRECVLLGFSVCIVALASASSNVQAASPDVVEFQLGSESRRGVPLMDFPDEMLVLGRDGQIHSLKGSAKKNVRTLDTPYRPATTMEMRQRLQEEFGRGFEVITTQHFLVVQPKGRGKRWPEMFERCHRHFVRYMSLRGVKIRRGRFPMVAVVMADEPSMYNEIRRMKIKVNGVAGIYARECNRVITHDGGHLRFIASTVRHEAAHQSAYNYNVHSRVVVTPRWVTEGIGQMFEPEVMVSDQPGLKSRDRVNPESLAVIRRQYDGGRSPEFAEAIKDLVGSDELFHSTRSSTEAYSIAWAMMFYLAEREPKLFARVLGGTSSRGTYQPYDRFARLNDFERWVGYDIHEFSKRVGWFLKAL